MVATTIEPLSRWSQIQDERPKQTKQTRPSGKCTTKDTSKRINPNKNHANKKVILGGKSVGKQNLSTIERNKQDKDRNNQSHQQ